LGWKTWWRYRALELTVALAFVASAIFFTNMIQQRLRVDIPADNWFVVNELYIPDFRVGENPTMTYDRRIKEPFLGFWVVEVEREVTDEPGRFSLECSGSGVNDYQVADYIPKNTVTWDWFIGRHCEGLRVGKYRVRGSWKMRRPDWPDKEVVAYSNIFTVSP